MICVRRNVRNRLFGIVNDRINFVLPDVVARVDSPRLYRYL